MCLFWKQNPFEDFCPIIINVIISLRFYEVNVFHGDLLPKNRDKLSIMPVDTQNIFSENNLEEGQLFFIVHLVDWVSAGKDSICVCSVWIRGCGCVYLIQSGSRLRLPSPPAFTLKGKGITKLHRTVVIEINCRLCDASKIRNTQGFRLCLSYIEQKRPCRISSTRSLVSYAVFAPEAISEFTKRYAKSPCREKGLISGISP